jgi:chemotaxis protein methyltransferase CheR
MPSFAAADLQVFRDLIVQRIGLQLDESKLGLLAEIFARRLDESGEGIARYLARVGDPLASRDELRRIAEAVTVPETYFFRHFEQFRALSEVAIPQRQQAQVRAQSQKLRILSAGCASGEEAYSLAILTGAEALPGWDVTVEAVDINCAMLARAARGRYSRWSLRDAPADLQRRWFSREGRNVVLDPMVRARVRFTEQNLVLGPDQIDPWAPGGFDVIFCRNVVMYFTPDRARRVIERFARALARGGFLFLGSAESLRGLSDDFEICQSHGTFYYQRKFAPGTRPVVTPAAPLIAAGAAFDAGAASDWQGSVQRASDRIAALGRRDEGADHRAGPSSQPAARPNRDESPALGPVFELVRRERYAEGLELLDQLPPAEAGSADVALLRAVLQIQQGQIDRAEGLCADLLARDDHTAGAHHVLALCREARGDRAGARHHDETAVALDPTFAQPRLHLGLLARRQGDLIGARRDLGLALTLLANERPSRLLLFGGGFARESLIALCRSELSRLEESHGPS